jgi:hypothetical protein
MAPLRHPTALSSGERANANGKIINGNRLGIAAVYRPRFHRPIGGGRYAGCEIVESSDRPNGLRMYSQVTQSVMGDGSIRVKDGTVRRTQLPDTDRRVTPSAEHHLLPSTLETRKT